MGLETEIVRVAAAVLQFVVGLALAMSSVYLGLKMFDRLTKGVDEWQAIKNGNVVFGILLAVAIIMAGVLFAVSFVKSAAASGISNALDGL